MELVARTKEGVLDQVWKKLIDEGVDVNETDRYGYTALMYAAEMGNETIVMQLLDCGADIEATDRNGRTALIFAVDSGDNHVVQCLINHGANVHARAVIGKFTKYTPLERAGKFGNDEMVKVMKKGKEEWSEEGHARFPQEMRDQVMTVMLMWMHDQYDEGECEGIRWNELPWEVVRRVIVELGWMSWVEEGEG
eukprot:TRINITY_DN6836_c0_g1_i2.p2 TRINITY_DN6836_c0_g1~~TRINITY_DN6836_c0_g1_i2.p2  ORF type:complete len:194 (-),score=33.30 TRINITY_DN6836_c0_g1_i2:18-599(-)